MSEDHAGTGVRFSSAGVPGSPVVVAAATRGFICTKPLIDSAEPDADARAAIDTVIDSLLQRRDGAHVVWIASPGLTRPVVLVQCDHSHWYRSSPRGMGKFDHRYFHGLGRAVATLAIEHDVRDLHLSHPLAQTWTYESAGAYLEGIGMGFDASGEFPPRLTISPCRKKRDIAEAISTINGEQLGPFRPPREPVEMMRYTGAEYGVDSTRCTVHGLRVVLGMDRANEHLRPS